MRLLRSFAVNSVMPFLYPCILAALISTPLFRQDDVPHAARRSLRCTPAVLTAGDILNLRFEGAHGGELGVRTPEGRFLFIAFEQETAESVPPLPSAQFKSMPSVQLDVRTAEGLDSITGGNSQAIFKEPGKYRFVVSENLETEDGVGANQACTVTFRQTRDP